ncbi:hypothetical protein PFISCL1PPCAC_21672, partial [Pristionchus fissidentatus]
KRSTDEQRTCPAAAATAWAAAATAEMTRRRRSCCSSSSASSYRRLLDRPRRDIPSHPQHHPHLPHVASRSHPRPLVLLHAEIIDNRSIDPTQSTVHPTYLP